MTASDPDRLHVTAADALDRRVVEDYVQTQRRIWPAGGAELRINAAGLAAFDGAGRDSRVIASGLVDPAALDELIAWHRRRRAAALEPARHRHTRVVLPADPAPALLTVLAARGFAYHGHALVMGRALADALPVPGAAPVHVAGPERRGEAVEVIARAYLDGAPPRALDLRAGETWFDLPGATHLLACVDGRPVGGAAVVVRGAQALLGQMAVLPSHRGRGLQRTLLAHRLRWARDRGAAMAWVTCAPSGPSHRNLVGAGFAVSHARVSWVERPGGP